MASPLLPRLASQRIDRISQIMPIGVLMGARQTGKSTLVRELAGPGRQYLTLDDFANLDFAESDPAGFVSAERQMTIDEVQRAPHLLTAIKSRVDAADQQIPGQYLLTGSANLLLMKQVTESLAGRASYVTIWPMTRREQLGLGTAGIWSELLETPPKQWRDLVLSQSAPYESWRDLALRGGYPKPAVHFKSQDIRAEWFAGYISTYLERDIPELSPIASLPDFRRVMQALTLRLGALLNQTQLARDTSVPQTTVQRYLNLLEMSYQLIRLQPYAVNRTKRLIKTPKVYWNDTGLALHLAGEQQPRGEHLENLIVHDLLVWKESRVPAPQVLYWRTTTGHEVDVVIEDGQRLLPIEVKTTTRPSSGDMAGMRTFLEEYPEQAAAGLLLYNGDDVFWVAKDVLAVPWWRVI